MPFASSADRTDGPLRRLLLAVIVVGAAGLLADLALSDHFDSVTQWIPLALLVAVLGAAAGVHFRGGRRAVRVFQGVTALCVVAGAVGVWLHYRGNVEWELERDASLGGLRLFWEAVRGATPALAPGALSQLGLFGLVYAYRHPALAAPGPSPHERP
jgi:hypothetical protein